MSSWVIWYVTWCASLTISFHHHPLWDATWWLTLLILLYALFDSLQGGGLARSSVKSLSYGTCVVPVCTAALLDQIIPLVSTLREGKGSCVHYIYLLQIRNSTNWNRQNSQEDKNSTDRKKKVKQWFIVTCIIWWCYEGRSSHWKWFEGGGGEKQFIKFSLWGIFSLLFLKMWACGLCSWGCGGLDERCFRCFFKSQAAQ